MERILDSEQDYHGSDNFNFALATTSRVQTEDESFRDKNMEDGSLPVDLSINPFSPASCYPTRNDGELIKDTNMEAVKMC